MMGTNIPVLLNEIWSTYRQAGITDDLRIIESLAALLLEQEEVLLTDDLPRKAKISVSDESDIRKKLKDASEQAAQVFSVFKGQQRSTKLRGAGILFDRYILFRLRDMQAGQYPTPRHIVRLMTALAETQGQSVADFACGSGGLLVHSGGRSLRGIELSPEWVRLARANLRLHDLRGEIEEGNSLRLLKPNEDKFPRIVMNPPFGAKVDKDLGARSETALTNLALNLLAERGRAALLVPSGLLFSGGQAEWKTRQRLVDQVTLEAVITLPRDAFQPYSTLTTHLLLIHNVPPVEPAFTWFIRPVYDGYLNGRGRDLTADPHTPNDLTLTEHTIAALRQISTNSTSGLIEIQPLIEEETLLGILLLPHQAVTLLNVRSLPGTVKEPACLLVEIQHDNSQEVWKVLLTNKPDSELVNDHSQLIHHRLGLRAKDTIPAPDIFQHQSVHWGQSLVQRVGGILVKTYGDEKPQLMGVAIPNETIRLRDYALQPDDYLRAPEISLAFRRPHEILQDIYESQHNFSRHMDRLAAWLVPERPKERHIPAFVPDQMPFEGLNDTQQEIWKWVSAQKDGRGSAKPFTLEQIQLKVECSEDEKRQALTLFESMGLIVPITLKNPKNEQNMNFYRLVETNDIWTGSPEETSQVEERNT